MVLTLVLFVAIATGLGVISLERETKKNGINSESEFMNYVDQMMIPSGDIVPLKDFPRVKRFLDEEGEDGEDFDVIVQAVQFNQISDDLDELKGYATKNLPDHDFYKKVLSVEIEHEGRSITGGYSVPIPLTRKRQYNLQASQGNSL